MMGSRFVKGGLYRATRRLAEQDPFDDIEYFFGSEGSYHLCIRVVSMIEDDWCVFYCLETMRQWGGLPPDGALELVDAEMVSANIPEPNGE